MRKGEIPTPQNPVRVARPEPMANPLDAMMAPKGPPIVMPQALMPRAMPSYFPKFGGLLHEDSLTHIEQYIEVMLANVIAKDTYKLRNVPSRRVKEWTLSIKD